jgi:hypothetical protein
MSVLSVNIESWYAWVPGVESESDWQQWFRLESIHKVDQAPDVSFIPAMVRRRLSSLSRAALMVSQRCLQNVEPPQATTIRTVFCSRHGELNRTLGLLQDLTDGQLLSPTAFSMSVHNTASGLYSIINNNTAATTALAGGVDGFEKAFVESVALLANGVCKKVLLVVADEPVPEQLLEYCQEPLVNYAAAFLLTQESLGQRVTLELQGKTTEAGDSRYPHALAFVRLLTGIEEAYRVAGEQLVWQWGRNAC